MGEWKNLMVSFNETSILIKTGVGEPLKFFVPNAEALRDLREEGIEISDIAKYFIFDIAYKASKTAFVVKGRADIYNEISNNHLMPALYKLSKLIAMNDLDEI